MLNWIAIWVGTYLFGDGGPLQNARTRRSRSRTTSPTRPSCRCSGATRSCRACTSASSSRSRPSSSSGSLLNRTTLGYEVRAVGFNPEAAAYGGISVKQEPDPRDGDLGRVRRPRGRARHARLPVPLRRLRHPGVGGRLPRDRGRAARPQHRGRRRPRRAPLRRAALRDERTACSRARSTRSSPATSPT